MRDSIAFPNWWPSRLLAASGLWQAWEKGSSRWDFYVDHRARYGVVRWPWDWLRSCAGVRQGAPRLFGLLFSAQQTPDGCDSRGSCVSTVSRETAGGGAWLPVTLDCQPKRWLSSLMPLEQSPLLRHGTAPRLLFLPISKSEILQADHKGRHPRSLPCAGSGGRAAN